MKRILSRALTPSFAVSALALSVALGGGAAWATARAAAPQATTVRCVTLPASAFRNGWTSVAASGFHKVEVCKDALGYVHLDGLAIPGTSNATAFVLPKADRPKFNHAFAVAAGTSSPQIQDVDVFKNGDVFMFGSAPGAVTLDGVTYHLG